MSSVGLSISRKVPFKTVLANASGGPQSEKQALLANQNEYNEFFDGHPPATPIDFTEGFVFAIALGQRPTGGFAVKVRSVTQITQGIWAGALTINYEELFPSGPTTDALTAPFTIIRATEVDFATHINFHRVKASFIVISLIEGNTGCRIVPEGALFPQIYRQAFGPASESECQQWIAANCQ